MSRWARQTLELALAHLPPALLPPGGIAALRRGTAHLAPGRQLYFECRLGSRGGPVDVSQHFFAAAQGPEALRALALRGGGAGDGAWDRLARLAEQWRDDPVLAAGIAEIGLEHDCGVAAPAVFAACARSSLHDRAGALRFLELVVPGAREASRRMFAALEAAERHGLAAGRVIGAMLSRDAQLRCMVRGTASGRPGAFLDAIGWPGDRDAIEALLALPFLQGEAVRLVLGFAPAPAPGIGIELILEGGRRGDADAGLLGWMVAQGLADPRRVAALDLWSGALTPVNAAAPWPDALIVQDLAGPGDRIACFLRFLNHLKLNVDADGITAKAYLALAPYEVTLG